jgi:type 1 glutamine amidotransferase
MRIRSLGALVVLALLSAAHSFSASTPQAPGSRGQATPPAPKKIVIVTGENSFSGHVWKDTSAELKRILDAGGQFAPAVIEADPNFIANDTFLTYDIAVFDFRNANPLTQQAKVEANLLQFFRQGKGLVTVHWANGAFPNWPEYLNIVGLAQQSVHDRRGPFKVKIANANHPITRGLADFDTDDELYWDHAQGNRNRVPLAVSTSNVHFEDFVMAHTQQYLAGRVFNTSLGHDVKALQFPGTAELIRRGAAWVGKILQ